MSSHRSDLEKQAAIDLAIDYENGCIDLRCEKEQSMSKKPDVIVDLLSAAHYFVIARRRLLDACLQIADQKSPETVTEVLRRLLTAEAKKEYWKKVKCEVCNLITGSRVANGVRYPLVHKDPDSLDELCLGSFSATLPIKNRKTNH